MNKPNTINFTPDKLTQLKAKYDKARIESRDTFMFEGQQVFVPYAKYLIEYLESRFTPSKKIKIQ